MTKECERGVRAIFPRLDFRVMHLTPGVKLELGERRWWRQPFDVVALAGHPHHGIPVHVSKRGDARLRTGHRRPPDVEARARNADVLMLDGSPATSDRAGTCRSARASRSRTAEGQATLFTHVGHRTGTFVELEAWLDGAAEVAYDGLEIEL